VYYIIEGEINPFHDKKAKRGSYMLMWRAAKEITKEGMKYDLVRASQRESPKMKSKN
jgi:hypothetical protein